jgi:ubiquinone biosynthesis protein
MILLKSYDIYCMNLIYKIKVLIRIHEIIFRSVPIGLFYLINKKKLSARSLFSKSNRIVLISENNKKIAKGFRELLESLGPVFVKFGQILSTRYDLLSAEYINELKKLQYSVSSLRESDAKETIEKSFGQEMNNIFKYFDFKPFASASLGLVYKAKLVSGQDVAVKVQRPGIKKQVRIDSSVLFLLINILERKSPKLKKYNLKNAVAEFKRWTLNEIDYKKEATNYEIFNGLFKDDKNILTPKVFWKYTNTDVLTLELIEGFHLQDIIENNLSPQTLSTVNKKTIAKRFGDTFIFQYFKYGFFHADPHPGNIIIDKKNRLFFLDFGMVGIIDSKLVDIASGIFLSLLQKDADGIVQNIIRLENEYTKDTWKDKVDESSLSRDITELVLDWSANGKAGKFTELYYRIVNSAICNGVTVPVDLIMLSKSIVTIDIIIQKLNPDFRLENWETKITISNREKQLKKWDLSHMNNLIFFINDLAKDLPESLPKILKNLEGDKESEDRIHKQELIIINYMRFNLFFLIILISVIIYLLLK